MITSYSNTTKAQRDEMVSKWKTEISDLKKNIRACEQKRSQLDEDNAENISKRDSVNDKIDAKKRTGGWVIALEAIPPLKTLEKRSILQEMRSCESSAKAKCELLGI